MKLSRTEALCTRCGLCCDGSLFADVELAGRDEASALEVMGLEIEDGDGDSRELLLQPCRALKGKRCGIYPHRPECCRTFECRLLQEVQRGVVGVEQAGEKIAETLRQIERVKQLIAQSGPGHERLPLKEQCVAALEWFEETVTNPERKRMRVELQAAMSSVERLIRATFLAG